MGLVGVLVGGIIGVLGSLVAQWFSHRLRFHQTRFERLHERQAEIIAELYSRLAEVKQALFPLLDSAPATGMSSEETADAFRRLWEALLIYFDKNRLYFHSDVRSQIEALSQNFGEALRNYRKWHSHNTGLGIDEQLRARDDNFGPVRKKISAVAGQLERSFQATLGIR